MEKRPVTYAILIWLLMLFCYVVGGAVQEVAKLPSPMGGLISTQLLAVLSLVIIGRLGWWRETGLTAPMARGGWRPYWLPLAWMVLNLALHGTKSVTLGAGLSLLLLAVLSGYVEEIYFRGILMRALLPRGRGWAIGVTVALFSLTHLLNLLGGRDPLGTLAQVGYAAAIGFFFAAIWLRTRAVWPLALTHGLNNLVAFLTEGGTSTGALSGSDLLFIGAIVAGCVACGAYLLRESGGATTAAV